MTAQPTPTEHVRAYTKASPLTFKHTPPTSTFVLISTHSMTHTVSMPSLYEHTTMASNITGYD